MGRYRYEYKLRKVSTPSAFFYWYCFLMFQFGWLLSLLLACWWYVCLESEVGGFFLDICYYICWTSVQLGVGYQDEEVL